MCAAARDRHLHPGSVVIELLGDLLEVLNVLELNENADREREGTQKSGSDLGVRQKVAIKERRAGLKYRS